VTFSVGSGGGSVTGEEQATRADGLAIVGSWRLGDHSGSNTLQATSAGLSGSPVTFTATAVKGVVVEVRDNYFHSVRNGSGAPPHYPDDIFGQAAIDTIAVGESVTWMWVGRNHNVTSQFDPSGTHNAPHSFTLRIQGKGTYLYYCTNHSQVSQYFDLQGMMGRIVVR
jgi:plastocyanin